MLYIDPESCTECGACAAECPEIAIFSEYDVPESERPFIQLNAEMAQVCPTITETRPRK